MPRRRPPRPTGNNRLRIIARQKLAKGPQVKLTTADRKARLEDGISALKGSGYRLNSRPAYWYNCIAYAAGENHRHWWPCEENGVYWPPEAPMERTVAAFVAAFGTLRYSVCDSPELEEGFQKVAIYLNSSGLPEHAALQSANGSWKSKIGQEDDIVHKRLEDIAGPLYGKPKVFLKRSV